MHEIQRIRKQPHKAFLGDQVQLRAWGRGTPLDTLTRSDSVPVCCPLAGRSNGHYDNPKCGASAELPRVTLELLCLEITVAIVV